MHFKLLFKFITRFPGKKYSEIKINDLFYLKKSGNRFCVGEEKRRNANKRRDVGVKIADVANV